MCGEAAPLWVIVGVANDGKRLGKKRTKSGASQVQQDTFLVAAQIPGHAHRQQHDRRGGAQHERRRVGQRARRRVCTVLPLRTRKSCVKLLLANYYD